MSYSGDLGMMKHTTDNRQTLNRWIVFLIAIALWGMGQTQVGFGQQGSQITLLDTTVQVNAIGNAQIQQTLSLPPQSFQRLRRKIGNPIRLVRMMHDSSSWNLIERMTGTFEELKNEVHANYSHLGYSRSNKQGSWTIHFSNNEDARLVTVHENVAIFNSVSNTDSGPMTIIYRIHTPVGSRNLEFNRPKKTFSYDFSPDIANGDQARSELEINCKPQLMSSLAKLYGNDQLESFWAARSIFKNVGDTTLNNYRVRFRVDGFSGWSNWKKSAVVFPGQTVVDAFYPVFDLEKLSHLTGSRPAMVQCQYEYEVNGETRKDSDATRLQLTSRNEVVYSSRPDNQNLDWYEQHDLAEYILAAFSTSQDPVIQQVAGAVSGMTGGIAASSDDEQALQFLKGFWNYLELNKVAYHTPPGWSMNGYFGQHIKYGRDVIRNRAGTCIDLAILWASVAKAVGLRTHIAMVWGHAYPIIELPGGNFLPIESTLIGKSTFDEAVNVGIKNFANPKRGLIIVADIESLEAAGVRSLDLPKIDDNFLSKIGYRSEMPSPDIQNHNNATQSSQNSNATDTAPEPRYLDTTLYGTWFGVLENEDDAELAFLMHFDSNGNFRCANGVIENDQFQQRSCEEGTWWVQNGTLSLNSEAYVDEYTMSFEDGFLFLRAGEDHYFFKRLEN